MWQLGWFQHVETRSLVTSGIVSISTRWAACCPSTVCLRWSNASAAAWSGGELWESRILDWLSCCFFWRFVCIPCWCQRHGWMWYLSYSSKEMVLWETEVAYWSSLFCDVRWFWESELHKDLFQTILVGSDTRCFDQGASAGDGLVLWDCDEWIGDVVSFFKAQESTVIRKAFLCRIQRWHDKGLPGHQWLCGMNCIVLVGETLLKAIWVSKIQKGERQTEPAFIKGVTSVGWHCRDAEGLFSIFPMSSIWFLSVRVKKMLMSKKSPTGPTERTPKPKYLIAFATYLGVRW